MNKGHDVGNGDHESIDSHLVNVSFDLAEELGTENEASIVYNLEDRLELLLEKEGAGEVDGHDFGDDECVIYIYGKDADQIVRIIRPQLELLPFRPVRLDIRYGHVDDTSAPTKREMIT
jgi:hypothetical protein